MALEDIFKALEHQAQRDIDDVLAEARLRASGIVGEAEAEAQRIRDSHASNAASSGASHGVQSMNAAKLEARRRISGVRQHAVEQAFDTAKMKLSEVRSSGRYAQLFGDLLDEALVGVEGEFDLLVDPRDEQLARDALASRGLKAEVRPELTTSGGLVISMSGGRVFRRNTLEDRFDKLAGMAQAEVSELLFS